MDIGSWGLRAMRGVGAAAVVMAGLLGGCGGGDVPEGNEHVQYDGTTLIVEGTPYERDTSIEEGGYTPSIIVMHDSGSGRVARAAQRYGLEHVGYTVYGEAVVKVPEGYEFQWVKAFRSEALGEHVGGREARSDPRPVVLTAAGERVGDDADEGVVAEADDADIPDEEPSDSDVERLMLRKYGQLEQAGGLPAAATATGDALQLRAHLFEVHKEECTRLPPGLPDQWQCSASVMIGMCNGDCDPSRETPRPSSKRINVRWNPDTREFE